MNKYLSPIVTSVLTGSVIWVIDSIIFAVGQPSVSISGALLTEVSTLRLSVRLLVFFVCLLAGIICGWGANFGAGREILGGFKADELFSDEDYLAKSAVSGFSGDDTLRGTSYVESIKKNPQVDVANRPIYFSDQVRRVFNRKPEQRRTVKPLAVAKAVPDDVVAERFGAVQKSESQLLWQYCGKLGSVLKLDVQELAAIRTLCFSYDVGRHVSGADDENHVRLGAEIAQTMPELAPAAKLILTHHEKWDGSGILGVAGLDIPLGSRIFAVAWVYNAFTKPYGAWRLSAEDALDMLQMYSGTALDPELVALFVGMVRQYAPGAVREGIELRQTV